MYIQLILLGILAAINIFSIVVMGYDKRKAIRGGATERTPEGFIFFLAALFGSLGVYAGMFLFRHKIRKWYFQIGVPLLILQNIATLYVVWELFTTR
jgi:uncharacterized membrane protein YsdA (DUF1294 family)